MENVNNPSSSNSNVLDLFFKDNPSIRYVRLQWIDYSGVVSARITTKAFALSLATQNLPISTVSSILSLQSIDASALLEEIHIGEDQIWPDWSSLKVCYYQPKHAQVMCWVHDGGITSNKGYRTCPRSRLLEATDLARSRHDIDVLIGIEIEFYIMRNLEVVPMTPNAYSTASLRNEYLPILEEIIESLVSAGIQPRQFHSEGASRGMFELSLEPMSPIAAADAFVYSAETIKTVTARHGFQATLAPKPFEKLSPAGTHLHLSISQTDKEDPFLAGLLRSWASLAAFYMPNYDSYTRVPLKQKVTWSYQNRSATIRKIRRGHWELRGPDGTANMYLVLVGAILAGLRGVEDKAPLNMKDPEKLMLTPLSAEEDTKLSITSSMPASLKEAVEKLKTDELLRELLGSEVIDRYVRVKSREEQIFSALSSAERKTITVGLF